MFKPKNLLIAAAVIVLAIVGLLLARVLTDDSPDEVSLEDAVASVEENEDENSESTEGTVSDGSEIDDTVPQEAEVEASFDGINGTWVVDTESGEFDYETATGSFVGFRIDEELTVGEVTAVGRTDQLVGTLTVEDDSLVGAEVTVEVSGFTTNDSRRDNHVQEALDTTTFPQASFTVTEPVALNPEAMETGEPFSATVAGELTMHGVTNPVEFDIEGQLSGSTVVVVGRTNVTFSDFDVTVPSAPIIVSVDDFGVLEFQLLLERQG